MPRDGGTNPGRADGAPEPIEFRDGPVDTSDIGWVDAPGILAFWLLAIVVFLQFFTRYVLNDSLAWTEEVARYLLILVCFLGSISAMKRGSHIMLEFMIRLLPAAAGKALAVMAEFITFVFFASLTWIGVELIAKTRQKMVTLPVPKSWIYAICVAALAAITLYSARLLLRKLRARPETVVAMFDPLKPKE